MSTELTTAYLAHDALKREHKTARLKLDQEWGEKINAANHSLLELVHSEGRELAKFHECDILVSPKNDLWVVLYVTGKAAQLPNLEVKVIPQYEMQRIQKSGYLGKTVEKFAGEAIRGWHKQGTMDREKIDSFWAVNRQGQRRRAS